MMIRLMVCMLLLCTYQGCVITKKVEHAEKVAGDAAKLLEDSEVFFEHDLEKDHYVKA